MKLLVGSEGENAKTNFENKDSDEQRYSPDLSRMWEKLPCK